MWIHFSKSGDSWGGGTLNEPFIYFGRIIADRFKAEDIQFPYGEIDICLTLPPIDENKQRKVWFNKLPHYYRGKTMIRISLPIIEQEQNLQDVFKFIHKAFDIIISKKKKGDSYDTNKLQNALCELERELQETDLWELHNKNKKLINQETIEKHKQERNTRKQSNLENKRLIRDLRLMYSFPDVELKYFSPYENIFCDNVLQKLRDRKFKLPNYDHLYIQVSDTFDNALLRSIRAEKWFVYGIAVLENYNEYPKKQEVEKKRIVFDLLKQGLMDIAIIDKLDVEILNEVLDEEEKKYFN